MMMQAEMYKIGAIGDGFLAIMARPSLEQGEAASMVNIARLGINLVVSLLEPVEARTLELDGERVVAPFIGPLLARICAQRDDNPIYRKYESGDHDSRLCRN